MSAGCKKRWYNYTGGDPTLPVDWLYSPAGPLCLNGFSVCAIYVCYAGAHPSVITFKLQNYIAAVLSTGVAQPTSVTGAKLFAYGKA
ncbi:hypothetical protein [Pedobacter sp. L105]|uniref:hypothetical protein n=1 Tax=Pedobacter sp. L105 TaxID=1641871 RepID=UPI00131C3C8A|nr:hypothetical protein [Pedobacter sp. L105]